MAKALSEMTLEELWKLFPIILKDHNPAYKEWYLEERSKIEDTIGKNGISRINHIGSTSVEGLIAKPTVDILMEIACNCDVGRLQQKLVFAGWMLMSHDKSDFKMSFNKGYTPTGFAQKVFHLHVRYSGDWDELYFRDYLLEHKYVAEEYGILKKALKEKYEQNRDGYTEAKTQFILKYTELARKEFGGRYLPE